MFNWQKELDKLAIPARRVLRLQQSFNRIQIALPGLPSQEATAYLCAFSSGRGVRVAAVFHLHVSGRTAIYLNDEGEVADRKVGGIFNEGVGFVESMGFMMDDLHIQHLSDQGREALWKSLPLIGIEQAPERKGGPVGGSSLAGTKGPSGPSPQSDTSEEQKWMPPSMRRRLRPSPEKIEERRLKLRESLGRFLASM